MPKFIVTFAKIFNDNFQYCGYVQLAKDLEDFCDKVDCGKQQILKNASGRAFNFIADINGIIAGIQKFEFQNPDDIYLQTMDLGMNVGKIVRTLIDFDMDKIE